MSDSNPVPPPPTATQPSAAAVLSSLGLGYIIAIALGFLVLFASLLLTTYLCLLRRRRRRHSNPSSSSFPTTPDGGFILPRAIFISDDDADRDGSLPPPGAAGLTEAAINSYPKFLYAKKSDDSTTTCSICLCDYREGEMVRVMPDCNHFFHVLCLDAWLRLNGSCPVCRNSPLPTPLSTPLAEVVPLAQYGDNRRRRS